MVATITPHHGVSLYSIHVLCMRHDDYFVRERLIFVYMFIYAYYYYAVFRSNEYRNHFCFAVHVSTHHATQEACVQLLPLRRDRRKEIYSGTWNGRE